jgi:predicted PurR-regulated permease PerM
MRIAEPRVRSRDVWVVLANTTALVLGLALVWHLRTIVAWILVSVFLALALRPLVVLLTKRGVKRGIAVAIVGTTVLGLLAGIIAMIVPLAMDQGRALFDSAPEMMRELGRHEYVRSIVRRFGEDYEPRTILEQQMSGIGDHAFMLARTLAESVIGAITIISLTFFMLLFGDELLEKAIEWMAPGRRDAMRSMAERMTRVVGGYITGTFIVATIGGFVMGTTLAILGVPYFLPLGLLMIVLGIIPFIGSLIGGVLVIGLTLATQGWTDALICGGVYLVYQQIENEILQPIVQRRTIRMNALLIALALLLGTALAGIVGALLALPIAGAIQVVLSEMKARRRARWGEREGKARDVGEKEDEAQSAGTLEPSHSQ